MQALLEMHIVNCRNRSWSLTAQVDVPDGGARGVILNLGGHAGGWSFYFRDGRPTFCYNLFGIERSYIRAPDTVGVGLHQVRSEFAYDGGGLGKGGTVTLFVDGTAVAEGRVERTEPIGFGYEFSDVGRDSLSTVTPEYPTGDNAFTGRIDWVQIEAGGRSRSSGRSRGRRAGGDVPAVTARSIGRFPAPTPAGPACAGTVRRPRPRTDAAAAPAPPRAPRRW